MHARTCTQICTQALQDRLSYCILQPERFSPVWAQTRFTTWWCEMRVFWACMNYGWLRASVSTFIHCTFGPHQRVFIEMLAVLHTHKNTSTFTHRGREDALRWWSHLYSVSQKLQWSMRLWDEKERGEDSLFAVQKVTPINLRSDTRCSAKNVEYCILTPDHTWSFLEAQKRKWTFQQLLWKVYIPDHVDIKCYGTTLY